EIELRRCGIGILPTRCYHQAGGGFGPRVARRLGGQMTNRLSSKQACVSAFRRLVGTRLSPLSNSQESADNSHGDHAVNEILDIVGPQVTEQPTAEVKR